jgi:hypothetical protein
MIIASRNPSNTTDKQYAAGYLWLSSLDLKDSSGNAGSGNMYYQGGNTSGIPNWTLVSNSGGVLNTLSDGSTTVNPSGGNIAIVSTPNQITVTSSAPSHELIMTIPTTFISPGSIASVGNLTAGADLIVTTDATIGNDLDVTNDVTIGNDLVVTGTITLGSLTVAGTVLINVTGNANTTIGNAGGSGAILIDAPSGDFTLNGNGNDIHIGDDAASNIITIGNNHLTTGVTITAGTSDLLLTGAVTTAITIGDVLQTGLITLGLSTAGQDIDIGSGVNASAQVIDIGNGASAANSTVNILSGIGTAGAGTLAMGNNTRVTVAGMCDIAPAASRTVTVGGGTVVVAAVTDTIDIGPDGATTNANSVKTVNVNTGGVTLGQVLTNIASGAVTSGTHTTSIASGNRAAGTMLVNLLTGTGTKSMAAGNADGLTTFGFKGPFNLNVSQNNNTAINSGTSTGTVTIGNALAGAIAVDTASTLTVGSATSTGAFTFGACTAAGGQTVNISSASTIAGTNVVNVLAGATPGASQTFNLMTGVGTAGTYAVNILTGASTGTTQTVLVGTGSARTDITLGGTGANVMAINNTTTTGTVSIGNAMTSGTIQIGGAAQTGATAIIIGNSTAAGGATFQFGNGVNSGAQVINIASGTSASAASTVNLLSGTTPGASTTLNIMCGAASAGTQTCNILATGATRVGAVNIGTGGAAHVVTIGSTSGAAATTINSGTVGISMVGIVAKTTNPCFLLNLAAGVTNVTGAGTAYTLGTGATLTSVFDKGTNATTSGVFTAPATGIYDLRSQVTVTGATIATTFVISLVTTARTYSKTFIKVAGSQDESVDISALCDMTATDTAHVTIAVTGEGGDTDDLVGNANVQTFFCGRKVA